MVNLFFYPFNFPGQKRNSLFYLLSLTVGTRCPVKIANCPGRFMYIYKDMLCFGKQDGFKASVEKISPNKASGIIHSATKEPCHPHV